MCGIAGFVTRAPGASPDSVLARMTDIIRHRGPDGSGYYRDPFASLGHRRLSIIDVAAGHQPMSNEDGALWIAYNGEIFNHADLRPALEQAGHRIGAIDSVGKGVKVGEGIRQGDPEDRSVAGRTLPRTSAIQIAVAALNQ